MLKRTKLSLAVGAAFSAGLVGFAPDGRGPKQAMDRVEITGSLIKRIEGETALPVTTLSVAELEKAGVTNAEQAVKFITQHAGRYGDIGSRSAAQWCAQRTQICARWVPIARWCCSTAGESSSNPFAVDCRRPQHAADVLARTHRGAAGRGIGHLRNRRDRRRDQLHHAQGISGDYGRAARCSSRKRVAARSTSRASWAATATWRPRAGTFTARFNYRKQQPLEWNRTRLHAVVVHSRARIQRSQPDDVPGQLQPDVGSHGGDDDHEHQSLHCRTASRRLRLPRRCPLARPHAVRG